MQTTVCCVISYFTLDYCSSLVFSSLLFTYDWLHTVCRCNKISDFELSPEKASALLAASNRCAHQMGKQTLCNIIYSFGKLGIRWDRPILQASSSTASTPAPAPAPPLAPSNLTMAISKHAGRLSEHDLSNVLFGMSLSGMRWQNLSTPLQEALVDALTTGRSPTTPRGVSNNLYGLCKLGVSWSALSEGCKSRLQQEVTALLPVMDELSFANALYA